jgi:SAM-dependent methyltransferase
VKNPSEFYDETYLKGPMSMADLSAVRWEDNGIFYEMAVAAARIADAIGVRSILDVGCGRGFAVNHLRSMGYDASGMEYGRAALQHSICRASPCDLTGTLDCPDSGYGLVICHGVLSHISPEGIPHAISELFRVTAKALWMNVLTVETPTQQHHKTFKPAGWWTLRLVESGFVPLVKEMDLLGSFVRSPEQAMFLVCKP